MMGRREEGQGQFFYSFDLEKVVPPDHLVRQIDGLLDLSWVHKELAPYYSHTGRPSIDPVLMIRMLIVGYVFALRSERRLCAEVQVNLAYRWFCKLGIEDRIPDHSVFCRARHERFRESDALRRVFEGVVAMCIATGLVGGEAFSIDASLIKADVDKKKRMPGDQPIAWPKAEEASHAVREYLAALDTARGDSAMHAPVDASYLADSVVLMRYFEARGEIRQAISVMKKRGGPHERTIREFRLAADGVRVGDPLREFRGVLTGVPTVEPLVQRSLD